MTDARVLPFPQDPSRRSLEEGDIAATEGVVRNAYQLLDAIEEKERQLMEDTPQGAADSRGEMAERQAIQPPPQSRAAAGLERVIAALSEELRKTQVKASAARLRKEHQEVQVLKSTCATLEFRLATAKRFRKQVQQANDFVAQVERGAT